MSLLNLTELSPDGSALLRNEPVQARSTARLASLLDAAAAIIDEIGYERLTTAMVAERAGASIGTVYRYFPDRVVVLQSLCARSLALYTDATLATMLDTENTTWWEAIEASINHMVAAFRFVPGFRSLRLGDVLDVRPALSAQPGSSVIASVAATGLADRFGLPIENLADRLEAVIVLCDSLLSRAFRDDVNGDPKFISEAINISKAYLASHYTIPAQFSTSLG